MISLPTSLFGEIQSGSGRGCLHRGLGNQNLGNQNLENPQSYKIAVDRSAQPLFQREVLSSYPGQERKKSCLQLRRKTTSSTAVCCIYIIEMDVYNQNCQHLFTRCAEIQRFMQDFLQKLPFILLYTS